MTESLSIAEARKLVLLSQRLPPPKQRGSALSTTLAAVEHLGYVQIDTISVIQRAHHHTLWNRNPRYREEHLHQLVEEGQLFEYWTHAASYLPMCDYRFTLPRKLAIARGEQNHWYRRDFGLMEAVLKRITAEGPLKAKDFEGDGSRSGDWKSKPAKRALECLFMQGDLMISSRENFHKVYDLTERVLPEGVDTREPDWEEMGRYLIKSYLRANGLGQAAEIGYLRKEGKAALQNLLMEMELAGEVIPVNVAGELYYAMPAAFGLLEKPLRRSKLKILSPFDNLLIQRKRMRSLFDFDYLLECYLPKEKRIYGYFSLPILWNGGLVARMDCKADRKAEVLHINNLVFEPCVKKRERFLDALLKELPAFLGFNGCKTVAVHSSQPEILGEELRAAISLW